MFNFKVYAVSKGIHLFKLKVSLNLHGAIIVIPKRAA